MKQQSIDALFLTRLRPERSRKARVASPEDTLLFDTTMNIMKLLKAAGEREGISLSPRWGPSSEQSLNCLPADLVTIVTDTLDPPYISKEATDLLLGNTRMMAVLTASPLPTGKDWYHNMFEIPHAAREQAGDMSVASAENNTKSSLRSMVDIQRLNEIDVRWAQQLLKKVLANIT